MEGFCRGCLVRYDEPTELLPYTEKSRVLYKYSTGIQIKHNENATFQLCKDCYVNMKLSCKFKKQCRTSDKKFKHYVALKEAGDAYDLSTFLRSNDESLRFPLLNGSSTPKNTRFSSERENDDNESTCTSIKNFMSDILQGEDVPDTEDHLIKEVIEEDLLDDDTLDSQLLQDEISRDTDFRDLSFSPFSTSHTTDHDHCYSPYKENDAKITDYDNRYDKGVQPLVYEEKTPEYPIFTPAYPTDNIKDDNLVESDGLFEEIVDQNVNYVTQNENDIADKNVEYDSIHNESYYAAKALQNENEQYRTNSSDVQNNDSMPVKQLLESNMDNFHGHSSANFYSYSVKDTIYTDINQVENNENEINFTLEVERDIKENCDKDIHEDNKTENIQNYVLKINRTDDIAENANHDTLLGEGVNVTIVFEPINENQISDDIQNDKDVFEESKTENDKDFTLDDLLVPSDHSVAAGASTPMINNILFGEKLDLDDDSNNKWNQEKQPDEDGVDILDEMLNRGIKEFSIHTLDSQAADVYDIKQCYCKTCDKKFKLVKGLKLHLSKFHGIKLPHSKSRHFDKKTRQCAVCGVTCNDYKGFIRHMKLHTVDQQKECSKCKIVFVSEARLLKHMQSHTNKAHIVETAYDNEKNIEKPYVCTICGRMFKTSGNFSIHMKRHSHDYVTTCEDCGLGFYRKTDLAAHMRVHTGEKPFECKFCDMSFRMKYSLVKHMKVHLDDKPFQCEKCSSKFILKSDLIRHMTYSKSCIRIRAGLEPLTRSAKKYECEHCNKKFSTKSEFSRHKTLHSNGVWRNEIVKINGETTDELCEAADSEDVEMVQEI